MFYQSLMYFFSIILILLLCFKKFQQHFQNLIQQLKNNIIVLQVNLIIVNKLNITHNCLVKC